jgi:hypothetical protein
MSETPAQLESMELAELGFLTSVGKTDCDIVE